MQKSKTRRLVIEQLESRIALTSYYVSPSGLDSNPGTQSAPFQTLQNSVKHLLAGDILNIEAGNYVGFICGWDQAGQTAYGTISGTQSAPITIRKDPAAASGSVIITSRNNKEASGIDFTIPGTGLPSCNYIILDGLTVQADATISKYGIVMRYSIGSIIRNCTALQCGLTGIYASFMTNGLIENCLSYSNLEHGFYLANGGDTNTVKNCTAHDNKSAGIQFNADKTQSVTGITSGNLIDSNILYNNGANGAAGINLDGFQNGVVQNNLIYGELSSGIVLYQGDAAQGSINNVIVNNTVIVASGGRWCLNINQGTGTGGSTGNTIFNNILYNAGTNGTITIDSSSLSGTVCDYNVVVNLFQNNGTNETLSQWQSATGQDKHSIISTPSALFVNAAANNYQLSATSPAVDAGVSSLAGHNAPTVDIVGTSRPQGNGWDIGAYELIQSALGVATHFNVTAPASTTAGSAFSITVTALDAFNNTCPLYTGVVHFTSSDGAALLPADYTFTAGDAGLHTFSNGLTLKTAGTKTVTVTDKTTSSITGSASLTVNPAAASTLLVSGFPSSTTAGVAQNFSVTALDAFGNTATGYVGTVTFTTTAAKAVLPANYIFTSADAGSHAFSATLRSAGTQSLTAKDTVASSISGSETGITVNPAAVNHLILSRFPSTTIAGVSQSFRITVQDLYGNTVPSYTGTVTFASTDSQAVLPANYTFTSADAGIHTFSATLKTAGTQSLTAKDVANSGIAAGTMTGIKVVPAATSQLQVTGFPLSVSPGSSGSFTVTAEDAYGNITTSYVGTVKFTSSDGLAILPTNYTFTGTDAGVHTFTATLKTPGTQSIFATDTVNFAITGTESGITVVAVQPTASLSGPSTGVPGQPLIFSLGAVESGLASSTIYSFSIQWGDGSSVQTLSGLSGTQITHAYTSVGTYTIILTAADPSGNPSAPALASVTLTTVLMETDPYNSSLTALYIGGTTGNDTIAITPVAGNGVRVGMNFIDYGSYFPTGHVVVYGQSGNDIIKTAPTAINGVLTYVNVPALFFAGDGTDTLNALGSIANNVLVGGAGADNLLGGQGRDILIGGKGPSTLRAGGGGDILIGGTTSYDNNATALAAVLAEWSRTDIDYATRIGHLNGTISGGLNGSYLLNTSSVQNDGQVNDLYGGAGMDWFFAGLLDVLFNKTTGEVVTQV